MSDAIDAAPTAYDDESVGGPDGSGTGVGGSLLAFPARPDFPIVTEETLTSEVVQTYLAEIAGMNVSLPDIRDDLIGRLVGRYALENSERKDRGSAAKALAQPTVLDEVSVATVLLSRFDIAAVSLTGPSDDGELSMLAMYQCDGPHQGLYTTTTAPLMRLASEIRPSLTSKGLESMLARLKTHARVVITSRDANLIAVNNGILDQTRQVLLPFSPDHVFLAKSPVDWDPDAISPVYVDPDDGSTWDVDAWIESLSDDEGVPQLLWELISATLRPGVRWNKAAFLHSSRGNNGKGTLCRLLRNLVGPGGCASIPIANFGKPFALSELVHARAIITDENSVGAFAKDLGDFKSVVTGDEFTLERKYRSPVSISFSGMVVQCVNDFPKSRDKSASYTRRQLFIPFKKWFGGGAERGYIKDDYLGRPEVLRYVLRKALAMTHTEFSEPVACQELLAQFQRENNPVRDFWMELEEEFVWDLLPTAFLFDLFVSWFRKTHPSGIPVSRNEFATQLGEVLNGDAKWRYADPQAKHRPGTRMNTPEPLVGAHDLDAWMNAMYTGKDQRRYVPFPLRTSYIGVVRVPAVAATIANAPAFRLGSVGGDIEVTDD